MERPEFIQDLIPLIMEAGGQHWWPSHLAALAAVSSTWLYYARKRLYKYPQVYDFETAVLLATTLQENPDLQSLVQGIALRISPHVRTCQEAHWRAVLSLLGLEGLKRVVLNGIFASGRYLKSIADPDEVEEIHVDGSDASRPLDCYPFFEWDEAFGFGFPSLRKLRLTYLDLCIEAPTTSYPSTITHLMLDHVTLRPGSIQHLLNGAPSLSCLHINSADPLEEDIALVFSSCAIECLHYQVDKTTCSDPFTNVGPAHGEALRCLHLDGPLLDAGMLNHITEAFRNLEELVVMGRTVRVPAQGWIDLISDDSRLVGLRRLGFPWGTNIPPFTLWPTEEKKGVELVCSRRSIQLIP